MKKANYQKRAFTEDIFSILMSNLHLVQSNNPIKESRPSVLLLYIQTMNR